jgi:hypothetical protein
MKLVTVVYEITNEAEWQKRNPLHYDHDGLRAVRIGIGDGIDARDALLSLAQWVDDECLPKALHDALERALRAMG